MPAAPAARRASRGYLRFALRRLGASVFILLGVTVITFLLTTVVPANPETANLGQRALADPEMVAAFRERYGLDDPLPVQYLNYLVNLLQGDLGISSQSLRPVRDDLLRYAPATIELVLSGTLLAVVLGVVLGVASANRRGGWLDRTARTTTILGVSLPTFWLALIVSVIFFRQLHLLPGSGRLAPGIVAPHQITGLYTIDSLLTGNLKAFGSAVSHLILPASVLAASTVGLILRFTRGAVIESLSSDYVRAARAKGLRDRTVLVGYAVRAAAGPLVTAVTLSIGFGLAATVYVEQQFSWSGLGQYAFRSSTNLDLSAVMGVTIVIAFLFVLVNLIADLLYAFFDPRIRL